MSINLNSLQDKWFSQKKVDTNGDSKISKEEVTTYATQAAQKAEIDRTPDEELAIKLLKPSNKKDGKSFFDLASKLDGATDLSANDLTSLAGKDSKIDKLSNADFNKLSKENNTEAIQASETPKTASAKASASANENGASADASSEDTTQKCCQQQSAEQSDPFSFLKTILDAINNIAKNQQQETQACSEPASTQACSEPASTQACSEPASTQNSAQSTDPFSFLKTILDAVNKLGQNKQQDTQNSQTANNTNNMFMQMLQMIMQMLFQILQMLTQFNTSSNTTTNQQNQFQTLFT